MSFKKKRIVLKSSGFIPIYEDYERQTTSIVDGVSYDSIELHKRNIFDESTLPSYPDPNTFNDLQSLISSGVPLESVNTSVIHDTDVSEINARLESQIDDDSSNTNN